MVIAVEPEDAGNRGVARGDDRGEFARRQSLAGVGRFEPRQSGEQPPRGGQERRADDEITLRSEEHTSELQSLMRISYAGFCLKKTNQPQDKQHKKIVISNNRV